MKIILLYIMADFDPIDARDAGEKIQMNVFRSEPVPEVATSSQADPSFAEAALDQYAEYRSEERDIIGFYEKLASENYGIDSEKKKTTKICLKKLMEP